MRKYYPERSKFEDTADAGGFVLLILLCSPIIIPIGLLYLLLFCLGWCAKKVIPDL